MPNLVRRKQVDQVEFSGFMVEVGNSNYYPSASNPSGYLDQSALNSATGTLDTKINNASGYLLQDTLQTGQYANSYTNTVSGVISSRVESSGISLGTSITSLSGYVISSTGTLKNNLTGASGVLDTKINTLSGYSNNYANSISGVLDSKITASSSATNVNNIVSGNSFNFTGTKIFRSPISTNQINISGLAAPSSVAIVAYSGSVSIVGSGGAFISFIETGTTNSLWSVADSAGLPMLELFDDFTLVLGHSTKKSIVLSGISGYVLLPNLPISAAGLPSGTVYRDGNFLKIV